MPMKYENGLENSIREFRHGCAHTNSQNRHLLLQIALFRYQAERVD